MVKPVFSFGPESAWVRIDLGGLSESGSLKISNNKKSHFFTLLLISKFP